MRFFILLNSFILTFLHAQGYQYDKLDPDLTVSINSPLFLSNQNSYCRDQSNPNDVIWFEDFVEPKLNDLDWTYSRGNGFKAGNTYVWGWGNNEQQFYRDQKYKSTNTNDNLFIEDGFLKIQPIKRKYRGFKYTSARIHTKEKRSFTFPSKITFCFRVPNGIGLWPAFWLLPTNTDSWPTGGEIDIMEAKGRITNIVSSALHYGNSYADKSFTVKEIAVPAAVKFQEKFHSITLEWREDSLKFFLNNEETPYLEITPTSEDINQFNYPFNNTFYLIINLAVGGKFDDNLIDPTALCKDQDCSNHPIPDSKRFMIDWIEYSKLSS